MTARELVKQGITNAENKTLGIFLNEPEVLYDVRRRLSVEMFSIEAHKIIYRKMVELFDESHLPNLDMLKNYLQSAGMLDMVGGEEYLNHLKNSIDDTDISNVKKYVDIVGKAFKSRELLKVGKYIKRLEENFDVVDTVLTDIRDKIDYVDSKGFRSNTARISAFLKPAWKNLKEKVENPGIIGNTTGYENIDSITGGYRGGQYWIIGGRPSHGKTALVLNSALRAAKEGTKVLIFSLEMNENQIIERLVSIISRVPHIRIMLGTMNDGEVKLALDAFNYLKELPIYISTTFDLDAEEIVRTIKEQVKNNGIEAVFIDYVQLSTERENEAVHTIGRISRTCKLLTKELNIFIGVVSQLNRNVEQRENKRPVKADLRQSGNLEEDADLIMFVYRDEIYNKDDETNKGKMELIVDKHRNGPVGVLHMEFNEDLMEVLDG